MHQSCNSHSSSSFLSLQPARKTFTRRLAASLEAGFPNHWQDKQTPLRSSQERCCSPSCSVLLGHRASPAPELQSGSKAASPSTPHAPRPTETHQAHAVWPCSPENLLHPGFKLIPMVRGGCSDTETPSSSCPKVPELQWGCQHPWVTGRGHPESPAGWLHPRDGTVQCKTQVHPTFSPFPGGAWGQQGQCSSP